MKGASADGPVPTDPSPVAATAAVAYQHDIVRQSRLLRDALQSDKVRVGCFLGAGCPSGIYDKDGKKDAPHLPDVAKLLRRPLRHLSCDRHHSPGSASGVWS